MGDNNKMKNYVEQMTISIVNYIEKKSGVCEVKNDVKLPAEKAAVLMWEQKHSLLLPEDLKSFYLTSNGFHLTWSVKMENTTVPVGQMHVNTVGTLTKLDSANREGAHVQPSLWDLDFGEEEPQRERKPPSFIDSKIFEIDGCDGYGKVCLVYNDAPQANDYTTDIWFMDRSLRWHFICDSFLAYYRLMLIHLGLPQWQLAFTDIGIPPSSKQWFNVYAPIRLEVDLEGAIDHVTPSGHTSKTASSPLDLNKIFKGKSDRKKVTVAQNTPASTTAATTTKKKPPVSSARSSTSMGKQAAATNAQLAVKSSR